MAARPANSGTQRVYRDPPHVMLWRLVTQTVDACMKYRVTGLAAEAAFFAILSLPPLIFGLAGTIGYVVERLDVQTVDTIRDQVLRASEQVLTDDTVATIIEPTLNDVLQGGRFDIASIGFVLALWSGSRALNVFIDAITIMYGLGGHRGIVKTRALSFTLYFVTLVVGVLVLPLVLAGPQLVTQVVPDELAFLNLLYWPVVLVVSVAFLATLYHLSVPVTTSWWNALPGAVFALITWIGGAYLLRWILTNSVDGTSIFGPLAAPIVLLIFLYLTAIVVLIGAALNSAFDRVWQVRETAEARRALWARLRGTRPGRRALGRRRNRILLYGQSPPGEETSTIAIAAQFERSSGQSERGQNGASTVRDVPGSYMEERHG